MSSFSSRALLTLGLLLLSACATLRDSPTQAVSVTSRPAGATILKSGLPVAQTPAYVDVARRTPEDIALASRAGPVHLDLRRHYRWRGSFWPNFAFLWAAPVGWAVDWLSGAAFDVESAPTTSLDLAPADAARIKPREPVFAIAPTQSDEPSLSDAAGAAIEAHLRSRRKKVLAYRETLPLFVREGFDFDVTPAFRDRASLYQGLGADVLVESTLKTRGDQLVLETRERTVFGDSVTEGDRFVLDAANVTDRAFVGSRWWGRLLPNSIAVDLAPTKTSLTFAGRKYALKGPPDQDFTERGLDLLTSLKITSLPARRLERTAHWTLNLVPTIRAARRRFTVPNLPEADGQDLNAIYARWLIGGGYGPEVGLQTGPNYYYLNLLPVLLYSGVSTRGRTSGALGLEASVEVGYLYYLNPRWNLRLFSRSVRENERVWRPALGPRLRPYDAGLSVNNLLAGISVGYRFEPHARFRRVR